MSLKWLVGLSGCSVLGFLGAFSFVLVVLLALFIELFLPFGKEQAWQWMLGVSQPTGGDQYPGGSSLTITGSGAWCVMYAYQESAQESRGLAGRVQGYVVDEAGQPLSAVALHVGWDGDGGGITQTTDASGYYVFILSPGTYHIGVVGEASQTVTFSTFIHGTLEGYGHIVNDVNFARGNCTAGVPGSGQSGQGPCGIPVIGPITATFNDPDYLKRFGFPHWGIDIAVPIGTQVASTMSGQVVSAGYLGMLGNAIIIQNGQWQIVLGHLSQIEVAAGQNVQAGQIVGLSGSTGNSTGPHVHYEIRVNGGPVDPLQVKCGASMALAGPSKSETANLSPARRVEGLCRL